MKILVNLEKKLKIDIKYFLKGGFWLSISHVTNAAKFLIIGVLFARFISKEEFGVFTYINSLFLVTNVFGASGMSTAIMQSVARGYEGTFWYLTKRVFLWSTMGTLFLIFAGLYEKFFSSGVFMEIFFLLALIFPFYSISLNFIYYLIAVKNFHLRMWMELTQNMAIIFSIVAILLLNGGLPMLIVFPIFIQTIIGLLYVIYLINISNNKIDYDSNAYGKVLNLANVLPTAKMQIDKILIANFLGYASAATYNIAAALADQVYAFAKIISSMVIPKSAITSWEVLQKSFKKILIYLVVLFSFTSIVLFFLYPYLIPFVFGAQYGDSIFYAQIITLFVTIKSVSVILQQINQSKKDLRSTIFSSYIGPIIELILMFVFILKYQILGVIIGKVLSDIINLAVIIFYFNKKR